MAAVALQVEDELDCLPRVASPEAKEQECVLLIEDNEEAMWLVRYALQEYGKGRYRLEWADTLSGGLEQIAKGAVDIVLLDLGLPDSSGPESYAWVREVCPKVPVVVLTGNSSEETEFAVTASGVEGYLVKDEASGSLLLQAIRAALYANKQRKLGQTLIPRLFQPRFNTD
jgi:DNA-binding NarL/FixJ family response regulator